MFRVMVKVRFRVRVRVMVRVRVQTYEAALTACSAAGKAQPIGLHQHRRNSQL